jgi:uncharacterized RDD family membrane protein YckC
MALEATVEAMPSAVYASWGRRFVAWLLDLVLCWGSIYGVSTGVALGLEDAASGIGALVLLGLLGPLYYAFFHAGSRGQTLGKRTVRIAVRDARTLGRIDFGRALGRAYFTWVIWLLTFPVGGILDGLWPLWNKQRQTWHDKVAGSVVVRV